MNDRSNVRMNVNIQVNSPWPEISEINSIPSGIFSPFDVDYSVTIHT